MRQITFQDGRRCAPYGTGTRSAAPTGPLPGEARPEIVEYMGPGLSGPCALPADLAARDAEHQG